MGLRAQPNCAADRGPLGSSTPPDPVYPIHRVGSTPLSYPSSATQPTADRTPKPPSVTAALRYLAVGMACPDRLGTCGCSRNAAACQVHSTQPGTALASPSGALTEPTLFLLVGFFVAAFTDSVEGRNFGARGEPRCAPLSSNAAQSFSLSALAICHSSRTWISLSTSKDEKRVF
jgi:hypothetical protein